MMRFEIKMTVLKTFAATSVLMLAGQAAQAVEIPWFVLGKGSGDLGLSVAGAPIPFESKGGSFPGGRYRGDEGIVISQSFDPLAGGGTFSGSYTFVNRRGHKLVTTFGDTSNGAQAVATYQAIPVGNDLFRILFIAEFNPVVGASTGNFSSVSGGSLTMYALSEPIPLFVDPNTGFTVPFSFDWFGEGQLEFDD